MSKSSNVFLVGPMGVGKTTIGKNLAKIINKHFIDLDQEIEKRCGANIPWIFDVEGESGFRERESAILKELAAQSNIVLATGGGAVLNPLNRKILCQQGLVVYLKASVEKLHERTQKDKRRPLLQVEDRQAVIRNLLEEREPIYTSVADVVLDVTNTSSIVSTKKLAEIILGRASNGSMANCL